MKVTVLNAELRFRVQNKSLEMRLVKTTESQTPGAPHYPPHQRDETARAFPTQP